MNVVEMHNRLEFYLDKVKSPRFKTDIHYDQALNIAMNDVINDRYDNIKVRKRYAFEIVQRIKDELAPLIVTDLPLVPVLTALTYPANYLHELGLRITIDGIDVPSRAITYNERNVIDKNAFTDATSDEVMHFSTSVGVNVEFPVTSAFTAARLSYIRIPKTIFRGTTLIVAGPAVLVVGATYFVNLGPVTATTSLGVQTFNTGDTFIPTTTALIGVGNVIEIQNCELHFSVHEEVTKIAANHIEKSVEDFNKAAAVQQEVMRS